MAKIDLIMPKMGESIMEATILKWLKKEGDPIEIDESILEIATDKVDSEVPAPEAGVMGKILFGEDETIAVGTVIAYIHTEGEAAESSAPSTEQPQKVEAPVEPAVVEEVMQPLAHSTPVTPISKPASGRFYSPLVLNIAKTEQIPMNELEVLPGTGKDGRVTKKDILAYLKNRGQQPQVSPQSNGSSNGTLSKSAPASTPNMPSTTSSAPQFSPGNNVEIVEMDRMRKLIADHMVMSKRVSPHVTSFVEADVTNMVNWRNKVKGDFKKREGQNITYTPLLVEAVVRAIKDFPGVNASVSNDEKSIIYKKDINIGIATALPSGNLIVPVVKGADHMNLLGLTKTLNALVGKARSSKLSPGDIQDGTFTLTNVGTFGNVMGTPIINQPQVAILAAGAIRKKPAVLETEFGDVIAIRHMMFLSLSYDHRIVDGVLGGSFLRRVADYLEAFDGTRTV